MADSVTDAEVAEVSARRQAYEDLEKKLKDAKEAQEKVNNLEGGGYALF